MAKAKKQGKDKRDRKDKQGGKDKRKGEDKRKGKGKRKGGKEKRIKRKRAKRKRTRASRADPFELYLQSVQDPQPEVGFMSRVYRGMRGRKPMQFREDFCATAYLATHWAKSNSRRTAIGVDLDGPTLDWGRKHIIGREKPSVAKRIQLIQANVLEVVEPKVDICCAFNFSYCIFKTRELLGRYFRTAYEGLADDGVFFCELFGGTEAIIELKEARKVRDYTYIWEQEKFNPITREILCHIHFRFPDGSKIRRAFTYDWRLWTIPEVRELLLEAGFSQVDIWWDPVDEDDYRRTTEEENQEGWLVYIVAGK